MKPKFSKTKIVATIGPSCESKTKIRQMIKAGVDIFRFNMKHGELFWHQEKMRLVREVSKGINKPVGIMMDLQGPEIRVGKLDKNIELKRGQRVWLGKEIPIDNQLVLKAFKKGQKILIDDGRLALKVELRKGNLVKAVVTRGGELKSRKGINIPGLDCDIPTLVKRDLECLNIENRDDIDWVALSFVSCGEDIKILKRELRERKIKAGVVAKIERKAALDNFEEILEEADAIMVARGDLGVEVSLYEVPFWQKQIIKQSREAGKPVITATEMLQSMVENTRPTRAEISDVANAIYDGTDAVMLSAETAVGKYPVEAVAVMRQEANFSESKVEYAEVEIATKNMGQTAAMVTAANSLIDCGYRGVCDLSAVIVLTETGTTVGYLSRLRPKLPILGVTANKKTRDQMKLVWGVKPYYFPFKRQSEMSIRKILKFLKKEKQIKVGENVVMIYGELWGKPGLTSVVRIQVVV